MLFDRKSLAILMIFDPLGLLTPLTIQSRILMQMIWASKIGWDEPLRENETMLWKKWLHDLEKLKTCQINQLNSAELHIFCDASSKAYTSVAYWKFLLPNNTYHVYIIMAKSRVISNTHLSIPRLEHKQRPS